MLKKLDIISFDKIYKLANEEKGIRLIHTNDFTFVTSNSKIQSLSLKYTQ